MASFKDGLFEHLEPEATSQEALEYEMQFRIELEQEELLLARYREEVSVQEWCSCSKCNTRNLIKKEEFICCKEISRCVHKIMGILPMDIQYIITHPEFAPLCLNIWVLEASGIGLRTRKGNRYTLLREQGRASPPEFYRSVAYRNFYRFVWEYEGNSKRLPLPCCVYDSVRGTFPSDSYKGFIEDDDANSSNNSGESSEEDQ